MAASISWSGSFAVIKVSMPPTSNQARAFMPLCMVIGLIGAWGKSIYTEWFFGKPSAGMQPTRSLPSAPML